jgi:hypothetical protein
MVRRGFDLGAGLPRVQMKVVRLDRAAVFAVLADIVPRFVPADSAVTRTLVATNLALNPDDPDALALGLEQAQLATDEATAKLVALERRFPNNPRLLALHADVLSSTVLRSTASGTKDWQLRVTQARDLYRRSIAASAFNPRAYFGLGTLYAAAPDLQPVEEGIAALDTAVIYEGHPLLFRALADRYLQTGQLQPALASIRNAVAFNMSEERPFDLLLLENLELLADLAQAVPAEGGLRFTSGSVYTGPVRNGKPEGAGSWRRPDGSSYEGEFKDGLPSGHGTLTSERGVVYEGDFAQGYAQGRGHMRFPPTGKLVSYDGEVAAATPHGEGVLQTRDGRMVATFVHGRAFRSAPAAAAPAPVALRPDRKPPGKSDDNAAVLYRNGCNDAEAMKTSWCRFTHPQPAGPRKPAAQ